MTRKTGWRDSICAFKDDIARLARSSRRDLYGIAAWVDRRSFGRYEPTHDLIAPSAEILKDMESPPNLKRVKKHAPFKLGNRGTFSGWLLLYGNEAIAGHFHRLSRSIFSPLNASPHCVHQNLGMFHGYSRNPALFSWPAILWNFAWHSETDPRLTEVRDYGVSCQWQQNSAPNRFYCRPLGLFAVSDALIAWILRLADPSEIGPPTLKETQALLGACNSWQQLADLSLDWPQDCCGQIIEDHASISNVNHCSRYVTKDGVSYDFWDATAIISAWVARREPNKDCVSLHEVCKALTDRLWMQSEVNRKQLDRDLRESSKLIDHLLEYTTSVNPADTRANDMYRMNEDLSDAERDFVDALFEGGFTGSDARISIRSLIKHMKLPGSLNKYQKASASLGRRGLTGGNKGRTGGISLTPLGAEVAEYRDKIGP